MVDVKLHAQLRLYITKLNKHVTIVLMIVINAQTKIHVQPVLKTLTYMVGNVIGSAQIKHISTVHQLVGIVIALVIPVQEI